METKMKGYELLDAMVAVDKSIKEMWVEAAEETNPEVKNTIFGRINKAHSYNAKLKQEFYELVGLQII